MLDLYGDIAIAFMRDICLPIIERFTSLDIMGFPGYVFIVIPVILWIYEEIF